LVAAPLEIDDAPVASPCQATTMQTLSGSQYKGDRFI